MKSLTCEQALFHVAKIFAKVHDETTPYDVEVNWIRKANGFVHETVSADTISEARKKASDAMEAEDE